jgi:hypothetical protein
MNWNRYSHKKDKLKFGEVCVKEEPILEKENAE